MDVALRASCALLFGNTDGMPNVVQGCRPRDGSHCPTHIPTSLKDVKFHPSSSLLPTASNKYHPNRLTPSG